MKRRLGTFGAFALFVSTSAPREVMSADHCAKRRTHYMHCTGQHSSFSTAKPLAFAATRADGQGGNRQDRRAKSETTSPTFVISGATRLSDYAEIGSLLVDTFDGTSSTSTSTGLDNILWNAGVTRAFVARRYTNRYVSTVRKMRGKKYALLLAKSYGDTNNNSSDGTVAANEIKPGEVVGVAELGLSKYPLSIDEGMSQETKVLPSVGVLAVNPSQRKSGIGRALLSAAESVVRRWNETYIYAAVEPNNEVALSFFTNCGYDRVRPESLSGGDDDIGVKVYVEVAERMKRERRPHVLLRKRIIDAANITSSDENTVDITSSIAITQ